MNTLKNSLSHIIYLCHIYKNMCIGILSLFLFSLIIFLFGSMYSPFNILIFSLIITFIMNELFRSNEIYSIKFSFFYKNTLYVSEKDTELVKKYLFDLKKERIKVCFGYNLSKKEKTIMFKENKPTPIILFKNEKIRDLFHKLHFPFHYIEKNHLSSNLDMV